VSDATQSVPPPQRLTMIHWLILFLAAVGFAFDIYEILVAPLIVAPALKELGDINPGTDEFAYWSSMLIYVPAISGGIFGLLGGYLTDYFGRRRVLTGSILLYAFSAFFAGFSTSIPMLVLLRSTTFIGVCVEFVAAVAWLAELFLNPMQRERMLGFTQAFSSFGGLLVAVANGAIVQYQAELPAIVVPEFLLGILHDIAPENQHAPWRYTLMSGLLPAIPLIFIRPFLPESPVWKQKKEAGTLKRPSILQLFSPALARTTIVTTLMFACAYGAAFGAIQHIPRIVPGLANIQHEVKEKQAEIKSKLDQEKAQAIAKATDQAAAIEKKMEARYKIDAGRQKAKIEQAAGAEYTKAQEVGGLFGRFVLALLAVRIVSRRGLLRLFQLPGLLVVPLVFWFFLSVENTTFFTVDLSSVFMGHFPFTTVTIAIFFAGFFSVAQFSFWGNYLPRVYPVHLRGTGESFAANIGGRALGVGFWWVTSSLATQAFMPGTSPQEKLAHAAAVVGLSVFVIGSLLCFFLPEPPAGEMAD
jgi:MFS family permease